MNLSAADNSALYTLVGHCLLVELDRQSIAALQTPAVASVLNELDDSVEGYLNRDWTPEELDEAAADYCALFVLPKGVSLTASYWIPGSTEENGHKLVAAVQRVLENFALGVEEMKMGNLPKDNIGLLLMLAAHLYREDSQLGDEFVANFVTPWAAPFGEALASQSSNPLYRCLGRLLPQILPDADGQTTVS